jgi:hypothetical protein
MAEANVTISSGKRRTWTLTYNGLIDTSRETQITMVPPGFARCQAQEFDPATFKQPILVEHNGNVGDVTITVVNDGDPSSADRAISIARTFTMLNVEGATGVTDEVSEEEDIPQVNPLGRRRP